MLPADQRLKADNPAGGELDLRLVVEHKLALVEGVAQVRLARPDSWYALRRRAMAASRCPCESLAQPAQFQLAGHHIGQALQHAQFVQAMLRRGWRAKMVSTPKNPAVAGTHRNAGEETHLEPPKRQPAASKVRMLRNVRHHHRTVLGQHHSKIELLPRQLAHRLAPVRLDPDAALVGKAEQHRVGLEIFGGQPRDGVEARLRRGVENSRRSQRGQPRILLLPIDLAGSQFSLRHRFSGPTLRLAPDSSFADIGAPRIACIGSACGLMQPAPILRGSCRGMTAASRHRRAASDPYTSFIGSNLASGMRLRADIPRLSTCAAPSARQRLLACRWLSRFVHRKVSWSASSWICWSTLTPPSGRRPGCSAAGSAGRWSRPPAAAPSSCAHAAGPRACRCRR